MWSDREKRVSDIHAWKTHSSKWVGDSQPDGGDQRRHIAEGQETKDGQREDGTGRGKDAPKSDVILNQTGHQSQLTLDRLRFTSLQWGCQHWLRGPANCRRPLRRCKPPPSDCSRCTGWTCWTINESNTLIFFKVTLCLGLKDLQRKQHLCSLVGPRPIKSKVGICILCLMSATCTSCIYDKLISSMRTKLWVLMDLPGICDEREDSIIKEHDGQDQQPVSQWQELHILYPLRINTGKHISHFIVMLKTII